MGNSWQLKFIGDISVQNMQRQSGIFIGEKNNAIGWSSHGKENRVIGNVSGHSNLLFHNISILIDPDFIDTPIDDRDINISFESSGDDTSNLSLESVNINSMQPNTALIVGKGHITGMDANQKANFSQGNLVGNQNQLINNININNDQDVIDAIMDDKDIKIASIEKE